MKPMRVRRLLSVLIGLAVLTALGIALLALGHRRPQDLPWTPLDPGDPVGLFTGRPCYRCFVGDAFDADDCDNCAELGVTGALTGACRGAGDGSLTGASTGAGAGVLGCSTGAGDTGGCTGDASRVGRSGEGSASD